MVTKKRRGKEKIKIERDVYELSDGNLMVLSLIPEMMKDEEYRRELRRLAFDYKLKRKTGVSKSEIKWW